MFVLKMSASFKWPVTFSMPVDGIQEECSFEAEFKKLPQSRIYALMKEVQQKQRELEEGFGSVDDMSDIEIAKEILVGWDGVSDGENPIPFTKATKHQLLEEPMLASRLVEVYFEALTEMKTKN